MLTKRLDGLWTDKLGFVAAIMLVWNSTMEDGTKVYRFLVNPFHTEPHEIVSNGEDDSVLVSQDMFAALVARKIARAMTDEEAAEAKKNADILETNAANAKSEDVTKAANEKAAKETSPTNPSAQAKPVPKPVKIAPQEALTTTQLAAAQTALSSAKLKKG